MKRNLTIWLVLMPIVAVFLVGCGDDDCPDCPTPSSQQAVVYGTVQSYDCGAEPGMTEFLAYGSIHGVRGPIPKIDSVLVQGHPAQLDEYPLGYYVSFRYPADYVWESDSLPVDDSATIKVYTPCGTSSAKVKLMGYCTDTIGIIGWSTDYWDYDSVGTQTTITIDWHPVADADWYAVGAYYEYDSLGYTQYASRYEVVPDTTFVLSSDETKFDGLYDIAVYALTGPSPSSAAGNFVGTCTKGIVNGIVAEYVYIQIGAGTGARLASPDGDRRLDRRHVAAQECVELFRATVLESLQKE